MALCVMNPIMDTRDAKINKCALKLLGIKGFELTDEEILESISKFIKPTSIKALLFDSFNNFYVLFLEDIDSTCRLVGKEIELRSKSINFLPLLDCYVVENVYPCLSNEELRDIFRTFGNVFNVSNHHIVPNSTKFSHVLSGKREITFLLPGSETEIYIPINVVHPPYSFQVRKFCCGCLTEGHSVLHCPDIDEDQEWTKPEKESTMDSEESHDELEMLIKTENLDMFEGSLPDTQPRHYSLRETRKVAGTVETSKKIEETRPDTSEISIVDTKRADEKKQDEVAQDTPEEEKPKINSDVLTQVVSSATVSKFTSGPLPTPLHVVKASNNLLPSLAEELINETCGSFIIEANVIKHLVMMDGRLKSEIIKFAFSYLDDLTALLKLLKKVFKRCRMDKKYGCLAGRFTQKMRRLQNILSEITK